MTAAELNRDWHSARGTDLPTVGAKVKIIRIKDNRAFIDDGEYVGGGWWRVYGTRVKRVTHWRPYREGEKRGE